MKVINWIKKLIPGYIEIRSLYWVQHSKKMDSSLEKIFNEIDNDNFVKAKVLISEFESTFTQGGVPNFVAIKYAEIYRAISMVNFLTGND